MKKLFTTSQSVVFFTVMMFCIPLLTSAVKPVAKAVQQKHDLNIAFPTFDVFYNAHEVSAEDELKDISTGTSALLMKGKLLSLAQQRPGTITVNIPYNGTTIAVELVRVDILTDDFSVVTGENQVVPYTPGAYYQGIVRGNSNSLAAFSFFNDEVYGVISDDVNGNIVVGRVERPGNTDEYVIYSDQNLLHHLSSYCNTSENSSGQSLVIGPQNPNNVATTKCVRFYYEVDHDIYVDKSSSVVNTTNWMTAVHNNVQTLYANDNITVALSQVYVWSTLDPYFAGASSTEQLDSFVTTRVSFNGDVGMLVGNDGGYGGLAYLNVLCTSFNYAYSDVDFTYSTVPTYSWTIEVITHEFGHNLGSPHTHNCSWPGGAIDDCGPLGGYPTEAGPCADGPTPAANGGTIMSYCHLVGSVGIGFNNGFGPLPAALLQSTVNGSGCLGASCAVCPVPAHNDCSTPATLSLTANCVYTSASLCGATQSIAPITCNTRTAAHAYDVWYSVVPGQTSMIINCQSGTSTDVVLALYSGTCGSLSLINCADATTTSGLETISATVTIGATYYVRVYDFNGNATGTDFGICASQSCVGASNNSCSGAISLAIGASCSYTNGDLCSATESFAASDCSGFTANEALDLWYSITPTQSNVRISCQSGIATDCVLGIFSGTCGTPTLIKCTDSTGTNGIEIINASLTIGNTYFIRVYDWNGNNNGTDFKICVQYTSCATPSDPTNATASSTSICTGGSTTLTAFGALSAGATWHWYRTSCGGTAVGTGSSVSVSPTTTSTYYVRAENGTCFSSCRSVTVTVNAIPSNPTSASATASPICSGSTTSVNVTGSLSAGATWHWYTVSCGGTTAGTGASLGVSPATTTTYYVRAEAGTCYSNCVNTSVSVTAAPNNPTSANATAATLCVGGNTTLNVVGTLSGGATWHWYSVSCGGTAAGTGSSLSVTPTSTTSYYVRAENATCNSNCATTTVTVNNLPTDPVSASATLQTVCTGNPTILLVTGTLSSGASWHWYADSCGGVASGVGDSATISPNVPRTYYVRAEAGTCYSSCVNTFIDTIPSPPSPTSVNSTSNSVCAGESVILSVSGSLSSGDWFWYTGSCGGVQIGQGATLPVLPIISQTYYVRAEDANCVSNCGTVTISVNAIPSSPTIVATGNVLSVPSFAAYQWYYSTDGLNYNLSGSSQQQNAGVNEYYFVVVTDLNGCTASSDTLKYQGPNGINENEIDNFVSVYPNPVYDLLTVEPSRMITLLKIYDDTGRLIYESQLVKEKITIPFGNYAAGIYNVLISTDGKFYSKKILKE